MSNQDLKIHHSNWMTSYFKNQDLKAFVSLLAQPIFSSGDNSVVENVVSLYALTLVNSDGEELFQECFEEIDLALTELEQRFGQWQLIEMAKTLNDGDGCSSCAAH